MRIPAQLSVPVAARLVVVAVMLGLSAGAAGAAEGSSDPGLFDSVLEKLQIKAKPAEPPPEFVQKTRPNAARLDYMQRPMPHKVSPIPTKSPDEVQATKDALDAAYNAQLNPPPPKAITPEGSVGKRGTRTVAPN